jgi:sulfoxide reductase heme-binding subunit YedZ
VISKVKSTAFKRILFVICLWPIYSISYSILRDDLGANPVEFIERHFGKWTLIFLCLTLSMTPLRKLTKISIWLSYRRMLGLFTFFYATIHLLTYLGVDYYFVWADIEADIFKHRYVLVGFLAWILLVPLAITSTNKMIQRLKKRWKILHRLVYLIAILGVLHFLWLIKKDITQPLTYAVILGLLLLMRVNLNIKNR